MEAAIASWLAAAPGDGGRRRLRELVEEAFRTFAFWLAEKAAAAALGRLLRGAARGSGAFESWLGWLGEEEATPRSPSGASAQRRREGRRGGFRPPKGRRRGPNSYAILAPNVA